MSFCPKCGSYAVVKNGKKIRADGTVAQQMRCSACLRQFIAPPTKSVSVLPKMVVTSATNNCRVNRQFLNDLLFYCEQEGAKLVVIPVRYKNPTSQAEDAAQLDEWWDYPVIEHLAHDDVLSEELHTQIIAKLKIQATAVNPLSSLDSIAKGMTTVIGHPQVQMKTVASHRGELPVFLMTTGSVTMNTYSTTKSGYFADFNHSFAAVVLDPDTEIGICHARHIHFDVDGIRDLDHVYSAMRGKVKCQAAALVLGDEHVLFHSPAVRDATFGENGLVDMLQPKYLVRHDVLDAYSISHHHNRDFLRKYAKSVNGLDSIYDELQLTAEFLCNTTPVGCTSVIVASNHNSHLGQWLNAADPKLDIVNAKLYHALMYRMLDHIDKTGDIADPFQMFMSEFYPQAKAIFTDRRGGYEIAGVQVGDHGDIGSGGSRGSRQQYAKLDSKSIIGHSHSPGIDRGCYQVGTSSKLQLEYNIGPSNWSNTHCVLHQSGKRQLINLVKGKFRP